jgi:hypothetical protein
MQRKASTSKFKKVKARYDEAVETFSPALLTPRQLSKRWGVTGLTLRRYRDAGKLRAIVLSKRMIRFSIDEVLRVEREAAE